nr:hypothetical protein Iba_chr12bCG13520 [Ipomoea batatas]
MEFSNALDSQRFSEESDQLERSTRKRKVIADVSGTASTVQVETTPLEQLSPAAVEFVAETPTNDPTGIAMQIEDVGKATDDPVADHGTELSPQAPIMDDLPRSYRDSVVGSGSAGAETDLGQEVADQGGTPPQSVPPVVNTSVGAAQRTKPYGSWMIVTRKDRCQPVRASGSGNQSSTAVRNTSAGVASEDRGASSSRYAPLENADASRIDPEREPQDQPRRRADKQPAVGGSEISSGLVH